MPMNEMAAIADLLARSDRSFIQTQHRNRTIRLWALTAFGVLYANTLGYGLTRLLAAWHGEDWSSLWIDVVLPAFPNEL